MRRIQLAAELNLPVSAVWELFADIENYPRYVKFMRSVELKGKPGLGTIWYDWTTILFLPMKRAQITATLSILGRLSITNGANQLSLKKCL